MTREEKRAAVDAGIAEFGNDFFMVDSRTQPDRAAPFRIQNEKDRACFIEDASELIPWTAFTRALLPGQQPPMREPYVREMADYPQP